MLAIVFSFLLSNSRLNIRAETWAARERAKDQESARSLAAQVSAFTVSLTVLASSSKM
jgi:hypothetical protein